MRESQNISMDSLLKTIKEIFNNFAYLSTIRDNNNKITNFKIELVGRNLCDQSLINERDAGKTFIEALSINKDSVFFQDLSMVVESGRILEKAEYNFKDCSSAYFENKYFDIKVSKLEEGLIIAWTETIAEKKHVEEKLRESEERFRATFENAAIGIALVSLEGKFIKVNRSLCEIVGYDEEELTNRTFQEITHPDDVNTDLSYVRQLIDGEIRYYNMEKRYYHKLGHIVWINLIGSIVCDSKGKPVYFIAEIQNISKRKEAEFQLARKNEELRSQRAEAIEANRLKSQFLANMSHELRTPLNSIIGFTTRVIKKSKEVLSPVQLENLEIVKDEGQHLLDLINSLLDYSKVEAGRMEVHPETFNLIDVINEVTPMVKTLMEGKPLKYKIELFSQLNIPVLSDRIKIKQILINLISNAAKYSDKGHVKLSVENMNSYYCIKVEDTGIGIAPENVGNIFDEFHQLDGSYTRKVGGTGLGLSITKKFVQMLGGSIRVESIPKQGSTFIVNIPVDFSGINEDNIYKEIKIIDAKSNKMNIVCVDDDQNVQRLYRQYIEESGFEHIPLNGEENVVARIEEIMPVVVILDIILPIKDGWQILEEIKGNPRTKKIPIIMVSVLSEENLAYRMKADEYLIKPVRQEELIETILHTVSKKNGINVLLADDDENFLNLMGQFLTEENITYSYARDGEEAIVQAQAKRPDLIILDIMMPKKDGFEVLDFIKHNEALAGTPVIVVTAKDLTNKERESLKSNASMIIQKSGVNIEKVMQVLLEKIKEKTND